MGTQSIRWRGFTLIELLVSTAIIALIMLVLVSMTNQTTQTWQYTTEKIEKFEKARDGFESMTRRLSQATLNTYWDYLGIVPPNTTNIIARPKDIATQQYKDFVPLYYGRMSELRFLSGPMEGTNAIVTGNNAKSWPHHGVFFQAPIGLIDDSIDLGTNYNKRDGMDNLINTWGYFLEVSDDEVRPPFISTTIAPKRWRSRLMEFMQPSEKMMMNDVAYVDTSTNWFSQALLGANPPIRTLAENITALVILPKLSKQDQDYRESKSYTPKYLSPQYKYDSTQTANLGNSGGNEPAGVNPHNQLPPIVQVTMIAIDERSAARLSDKYGKDPTLGLSVAAGKAGVSFNNLFTDSTRLEDNPATTTPGDGDLADYEKILISEGVTYRIFSSNVSIRGAKWSRSSKY